MKEKKLLFRISKGITINSVTVYSRLIKTVIGSKFTEIVAKLSSLKTESKETLMTKAEQKTTKYAVRKTTLKY